MSLPLAWIQEVDGAQEAVSTSWRFLEMPAPWIVVLVVLPLAALVAWLAYRRESLSTGRRWALSGLRFASLLVLLWVLARPVQVSSQERVEDAEVLVLIDSSASMSRKDAYLGAPETQKALGELAGGAAAERSRLQLAQAALDGKILPLLESKGYVPRLYRFDDTFTPVAELERIAARGHGTHLGDALAQGLAADRGRHLTDVIVVSDGRSNGGLPPQDAGATARAAGTPVHTVVIGDTRPERNAMVELVDAPTSVLEGDEVTIIVRVSGRGLVGKPSAQVILEEFDGQGGLRPVTESNATLSVDGERVVLVAPPDLASGGQVDERRFRVSIPTQSEERVVEDNAIQVRVSVTPERIRVLYVDGYPRFEYRQLHYMLKRADERISAQIFLMSATPDFIQESTQGMPPLERVPTGRDELLENYDVIILGDIDPYAVSEDPAKGEEFVASITEFVERGGGLCVIAGEYDNPGKVAGTDFAKLLPVRLDPTGGLAFDVPTDKMTWPVLQNPSAPHEIVRLHPDLDVNRRLWEDRGGLKGFLWYYPTLGPKPGAQVLLSHPGQSLSGELGSDPLLVAGYYPAGRTLFLAHDETFRWKYRFEERYHQRFWRNAIRWLALGRLKSGDRRYSLEPLRPTNTLDERVTLEARILDEEFRPSERESQEAWLQREGGEREPITLESVEGRPGLFRTGFQASQPGLFSAWIEEGGKRLTTAEFEVVLPSAESKNPSPDPELLTELSRITGGIATSAIDLGALEEAFPGGEERREPIASSLEDLWDHWGTLLLALGILSVEWILRKRYELV